MGTDFFTKPLQASQFCRLRRIIMGIDPISILELNVASPKERVGDIGKRRIRNPPCLNLDSKSEKITVVPRTRMLTSVSFEDYK